MRTYAIATITVLTAAMVGGCPEATRTEFPTNFLDANRIIQDGDLTPQERREELRLLGITDSAINALMRNDRLGNQFGGDLRSAFNKVTTNNYQDLTPDELQFFGDEASDVDTNINGRLEDEEAQAVANLFQDEDIDSPGELSVFLDDPANEVKIPDAIPDGVLRELFVDFDTDQLIDRLP